MIREFLILILCLGGLYAVFTIEAYNRKKPVIEYLVGIGATNIIAQWRIFEFGRGGAVFDVSYQNAEGGRHKRVCVVRSNIWNNGFKIYWEGAPPESEVAKDDEMEQLISNLMRENAQLRSKLQAANIE